MSDEQDGQTPKQSFPMMTSRATRMLPPRKLPPARRDDELTVAIAERDAQINQLLQHEFGSLAPPPAPSLRSDPSPRDAEARIRYDNIERRRKEYEGLDKTSLQSRIDLLHAEWSAEAEKRVAEIAAARELRWPHWASKDLWSEAEFAALCCGYVPEERGMPGDPDKLIGDDSHAVAINRAADDIRRGTLARTLAFVPRDDADTAARMYGTARHYVPIVAAEWAATRFNTFSASLHGGVRERAQATLEPAASVATKSTQDKPMTTKERNSLLRIIRALDVMARLPDRGPASSIVAQLQQLGFTGPSDDTIRKVISEARALEKD